MTELEKAARMALKALRYLVENDSYGTEYDGRIIHLCPSCSKQDGEHSQKCDFVKARQVITALTQALATTEPVPASPANMQVYDEIATGYWTEREGEPVGEVIWDKRFGCTAGQLFEPLPVGTKLYTSPQVPEDVIAILDECRTALIECDRDCDYDLIDRAYADLDAARK